MSQNRHRYSVRITRGDEAG